MSRNVTVSVSMPIEMVDDIEEIAKVHKMSRAGYIRHLIRQAPDSPFRVPEHKLTDEAPAEA
ncbi:MULTISPECIES: ribbon-helix-helix domain-containing protein [Haloferax]|uniref:CopG family transcriptional regulator n=1 Tax=Haloferax sulfurifontis TaxID=255616 RepID=A0A830E4C3_9EURY|nr:MULTISPECIES: ribbon-helix-helix domain-containing protein [Haloferax]GGC53141.1 hypothetical protein GCM10007209_13560 [Haloferax sulfurifontis]